MLKKLKVLSVIVIFIFMLPIITGLLPFPNNERYEPPITNEKPMVYASSDGIVTDLDSQEKVSEEENANKKQENATEKGTSNSEQENISTEDTATDVSKSQDAFNVLLLFTHSHESYKPFTKSKTGKIAVSDVKVNLFSMSDMMEKYFKLNGLNATTLDVDISAEVLKQGENYENSYAVARPFVKKALEEKSYDLIIDIHRDATGYNDSTVKYKDNTYAKIAFVIGTGHENYQKNLKYTNEINQALNQIIPNISRGTIQKNLYQANGIYNQDLAPNFVLAELGGIDNTEEEIYRSVQILAQAIAKTYVQK